MTCFLRDTIYFESISIEEYDQYNFTWWIAKSVESQGRFQEAIDYLSPFLKDESDDRYEYLNNKLSELREKLED